MKQRKEIKATIYCRVSGTKQVRDGDGLASQETRCREYAKYKGYEIAAVFKDDMTGKVAERPAMQEMLTMLRRSRSQEWVVIIDDISRLARGLEAHLALRASLADAGAKLESPSIEFGEDSDSILVENLLASVAQHHRQKNGEQTKNRMRARMMNGYWVFQAPIGYRYKKVSGHGKLLVPDEPHAAIITEALEGYASGRFQSQVEVKRFLENQPAFPKTKAGEVLQQKVTNILTQPLYAGYYTHENWGLRLIRGKHEPLIDFETWQTIQTRRKGVAKAPARKSLNEDFPLRGFVSCGHCGEPYTACWSKGSNAHYPYYLCDTKGCKAYRKSIRREQIEGDFEALLKDLRPAPALFAMLFEAMRILWDRRVQDSQAQVTIMRRDLNRIEHKSNQFLDRIVETDSSSLATAYENKVRELETQKALLTEKIEKCGRPVMSFEETYRTAFSFLENPQKLWFSEKLEDRRAVLKLVFADRLSYLKGEGYRTAETTMPFKALEDFRLGKSDLVRATGLEPVQPRAEGF